MRRRGAAVVTLLGGVLDLPAAGRARSHRPSLYLPAFDSPKRSPVGFIRRQTGYPDGYATSTPDYRVHGWCLDRHRQRSDDAADRPTTHDGARVGARTVP